jgi:uncharacterized protein with von Willebrand factor type A (vWA) domain
MLVSAPEASIVEFSRFLRLNGFAAGLREQADMVRIAARVGLDRARVESAWRALLCGTLADWKRFGELFEMFWFPDRVKGETRVRGEPRRGRMLHEAVQRLRESLDSEASRAAPSDAETPANELPGAGGDFAQGGASRTEPLESREFRRWTLVDQAELERVGDDLAKRLRRHRTRRLHIDRRGDRIDLRRTLRASLAHGGLPIELARRRRVRALPKVVVLVDASRSMETYSQLLVRFARVAVESLDARAFVFHTRIAEVTDLLRLSVNQVQERINAVTYGFGAGTRIASAVDELLDVHLRGALDRRSLVIVASDGFDSDPPEALAAALARVKRRGARLVWLHPLRATAYSRALEASAGSIDLLFPAWSVARLRALPAALGAH